MEATTESTQYHLELSELCAFQNVPFPPLLAGSQGTPAAPADLKRPRQKANSIPGKTLGHRVSSPEKSPSTPAAPIQAGLGGQESRLARHVVKK